MGTALFFLHLTRRDGKWKGEISWQGWNRVAEELGTPPGCLWAAAHQGTAFHVPELLKTWFPTPQPSSAKREKCFKARVKFCVHRCKFLPSVEGCDDSPGTLQPWAVKEWISHLSKVLKAPPWSWWKSLDQNQLWKCKVHSFILKQRPLLWKESNKVCKGVSGQVKENVELITR